jgi:DNA-binding NarL/FixJ family response regulator
MPTLLIVDDHAGFRAYARSLLGSEGFDVVGDAADGRSALAAAERLQPQVVLLDVALPDIDGFAVCDALTAADGAPAVVLTSTRGLPTYRWRLAASRARGFIVKSDVTGAALAALTG